MSHVSLLCSLPCRLRLAQCLQSREGMGLVRAELAGSPGSAAALAFLATAVKDHGAVGTCIQLFRWAPPQIATVPQPHASYPVAVSLLAVAQITDVVRPLRAAVSS